MEENISGMSLIHGKDLQKIVISSSGNPVRYYLHFKDGEKEISGPRQLAKVI